MKNINELREQLSEVFHELRSGNIETKVVKELNNTAGKIINSVKIELEYYALTKQTPGINFMNYDGQPKILDDSERLELYQKEYDKRNKLQNAKEK